MEAMTRNEAASELCTMYVSCGILLGSVCQVGADHETADGQHVMFVHTAVAMWHLLLPLATVQCKTGTK
eukprot:1161115-Pelagomonas_calceolata.AAC.3